MKKNIIFSIAIVIFCVPLMACTNTALVKDQSNAGDNRTNTNAHVENAKEETIFIDEKLDENLFISAELKMPTKELCEYSSKLKNFDYDKIQKALSTKCR